MEIKIYEEDEPEKNNESPIPLGRYKISYFAYHPQQTSKFIRAYQIRYAHDIKEAQMKVGVHYKLIYSIEKL